MAHAITFSGNTGRLWLSEHQEPCLDVAVAIDEGDALIISPCLDKGSIHLTVESEDGKAIAYDDDVDGKVLFQVDIEPGSYDITATGNDGATGWMTVFAQDTDELAKQDTSLAEALEDAGTDSTVIEDVRTKTEKEE